MCVCVCVCVCVCLIKKKDKGMRNTLMCREAKEFDYEFYIATTYGGVKKIFEF